MAALQNLPVTRRRRRLADAGRAGPFQPRPDRPPCCRQYNILPTIDLYATTQDRDLGACRRDVQKMIDQNMQISAARRDGDPARPDRDHERPPFPACSWAWLGAIVLIYLLIVVNFQSWLDPFVIITALPAALAGIVWTLFATGTTLVGAGADRRDHVHGRGDRQLDPGGELRARAAGRHRRSDARRGGSRLHPLPPGADDGAGDDHRHGAAWRWAWAKAANRMRRWAAP